MAAAKGALGLAGLRVVRKTAPDDVALRLILRRLGISMVFDVGAHVGQYALSLRRLGYRGRILSFEPQAVAFAMLAEHTSRDPRWEAMQLALGDRDGEQVLNVSVNSMSSSFLPASPDILQVEPGIAQMETERVRVSTLDQIYREYCTVSDSVLLKIDAQGYEPNVLAGARGFLPTCAAVQMEMALFPSYSGQKVLPEMIRLMSDHEFALVHLERGFWDGSSGYLIEVDEVFVRRDRLAGAFADRPKAGLAAGSESGAQLQTAPPS